MKRLAAAVVGVAVVAVTSVGCAHRPGDLSAAAAKVLEPKVQQIRDIASTGNRARLAAAITQLDALVEAELRKGALTADRARAIEDAADTLLNDFPAPTPVHTSSPPSPSPTPSATPTPTLSPTPPATPTASSTPTDTASPLISVSS